MAWYYNTPSPNEFANNMEIYTKGYVNGASFFMQYIKDNYSNEPIYQELLINFLKQFGDIKDMNDDNKQHSVAEWWGAEDGGVFCSNCGLWHDDYYEPAPNKCEKCGSIMVENLETTVWRDYRVSFSGVKFAVNDEYPQWLQKLRDEHKNKQ